MHHKKPRVLFICKKRLDFYGISVGLINSATFVCNALNAIGIECKVVCVQDNNCIDREVVAFRPTTVIIEALWVVPEKFNVLCKIHPDVQFVVRIHSKTPFLAMEGIAIKWIKGYKFVAKHFKNMHVATNCKSMHDDLDDVLHFHNALLPNVYMPVHVEHIHEHHERSASDVINIGCFGAIRPLKNHLIQAFAAIKFAEKIKKKVHFHINSNRIEQKADDILKNLRALFAGTSYELVEHPWMPHAEFLQVVKTMDIGMQVSLSESFNIVAADFVSQNVPVVVSPDVEWAAEFSKANPNSTRDIAEKLHMAYDIKTNENLKHLEHHNKEALEAWVSYLNP